MRILVTGRTGQLAKSLAEQAARKGSVELIALGRPELDFEFPRTIKRDIVAQEPDLVINAAAYTAVDMAESEPERAFVINRDGAAAAARAAAELSVPFIHMSTDYVFDGQKSEPYNEADATGPLSVYARSKLEGERAVLACNPRALILRTSWVFSPFGSNFVKTMLRARAERPRLRVVGDQFGNPTSALDLAQAILTIAPVLRLESGGLYHLTGQGSTNWHAFAEFIFQESQTPGEPAPEVEAICSAEYRTTARRPANSRLDCTAFSRRFGISLRPWKEAVAETVARCVARERRDIV